MKTTLHKYGFTPLVVFLLLLAAAVQPAMAAVDGSGTNTTTYTTSTKNIYDISTETVNQQINQYSIELIARMSGGSALFDQTFNVAYSDPTVQAAIVSAENVLTGAGAVSFTGPTLTSNSTNLTGETSNTVLNTLGTDVSYATTTYIGPQTIMVGDDQYLSFTIPAGGIDFDTLITSVIHQAQITTITDTYLTSQVYDIIGTPSSEPVNSVPEPSSLLLLGAGIAGLFGVKRKRSV